MSNNSQGRQRGLRRSRIRHTRQRNKQQAMEESQSDPQGREPAIGDAVGAYQRFSPSHPPAISRNDVQALQRTAGNRAVTQLIQAKLYSETSPLDERDPSPGERRKGEELSPEAAEAKLRSQKTREFQPEKLRDVMTTLDLDPDDPSSMGKAAQEIDRMLEHGEAQFGDYKRLVDKYPDAKSLAKAMEKVYPRSVVQKKYDLLKDLAGPFMFAMIVKIYGGPAEKAGGHASVRLFKEGEEDEAKGIKAGQSAGGVGIEHVVTQYNNSGDRIFTFSREITNKQALRFVNKLKHDLVSKVEYVKYNFLHEFKKVESCVTWAMQVANSLNIHLPLVSLIPTPAMLKRQMRSWTKWGRKGWRESEPAPPEET